MQKALFCPSRFPTSLLHADFSPKHTPVLFYPPRLVRQRISYRYSPCQGTTYSLIQELFLLLLANTVAGSASGTHSLVNYRCSRNYFSSTRVFFKTVTLHDLSLGIGETQIFHWTNVKTVRIPNTTTFVMTSQYTLWLSLDYWWVFQLN